MNLNSKSRTGKFKITERGCWEWLEPVNSSGYGTVLYEGRPQGIHRISAHIAFGFDLHDSKVVMHTCDNRPCFNPAHLVVGTTSDNLQDASRKGHLSEKCCKRGHEFTKRNTYITPSTGARQCRTCSRLRWKNHKQN
jgi:hypothetical protein